MQNYRKIFSEGLNADDDFSVITKGQWVNASNIRTFTTDSGATGRVEAVGGNALLFNTLPAGTNKCIGGVADETKKRILFFNWNSNGSHGIYCYDRLAATTYTVLKNEQVNGGLGFDKYSRIWTNAKIVDGLLVFTDDLNEPKCINIESGIKLNQSGYSTAVEPYLSPLKYTTQTLIKRPPIYPLTAEGFYDGTYLNNFTQNNAYLFTYRYNYKDDQTSALAMYSNLVPYSFIENNFNAVRITIPLSETIDDDIFSIEICVKYGNIGKTAIIKRWSKDLDADLINGHNSGTALTYNFYDDLQGEALDDVSASQSFDNVPLTSKTIEVAKDRNFLGHNKMGYDTPKVTSLTATAITSSSGGESFSGEWGYVTLHANWSGTTGCQDNYEYPFVFVASTGKFYYFPNVRKNTAWNGGVYEPDLTLTQDVLDATVTADNEANFVTTLKIFSGYPPPQNCTFGTPQWQSTYEISYNYGGATYPVTILQTGAGISGFFKSAGSYKATIAFGDRFRRKCGSVRQSVLVNIPERVFNQTDFSSKIQWVLSNDNAVNEIPDWAYYYWIELSKNQTTRFFVQGRTTGADYVNKSSGVLSYGHSTFTIGTTYATAIDISSLASFGMGYTYNEGDLIRIGKSDDTNVLLSVIGQDGNFVLCNPTDIGTLNNTSVFLVEIFTPYKASVIEPTYEVGAIYPINNPGTPSRTYSSISDILNGDAYALERAYSSSISYVAETMSPNDKVWQIWQTNSGWPNVVDTIGQKILPDSIVFSDTFIQGTKVNGLNKFQPLNETDLGAENGAIQKLQLANKVQTDGTVMLAICEEETVSMYLGEQEVFDTQGSAFIAKASGVIGTTKALMGSMGTKNPESVFEYNGQVFWWDTRNACAVQYSTNGLYPLSKKKFVRPAKLFSKKFVSLTTSQIEALGSDPFIVGGFDPYHQEVLFSIPSTETPSKGYLTDYPSIVYPYDIYDGQGKTLVYKHEADVWFGSMSFQTEFFIKMDNDLYSFKDGALWVHNQQNICNFYDTQYTANLMFANNPGAIHTFLSIGLESNKIPSWVHFRTEDPYTQSSDLINTDFISRQGVIEASLFRDRLSPNVTGDYNKKQMSGDRLFGKALLTMLQYEFVNDPSKLELRVSNIGNIINTGTLINK